MPSIFLSDEAAKAVCWTLVHSIWEGAAASLAAGAVILSTRKQSAAIRYTLLSAVLVVFILGAAATFIYQFKSHPQTNTSITLDNTPTRFIRKAPQTNAPFATPIADKGTILQQANNYLNAHATLVTLIWLACFFAQLLRLTGGLYKIHRLRHDSTIPATRYWTTRLDVLAQQLGIKRTVALLQSRSVKSPAAFGFL